MHPTALPHAPPPVAGSVTADTWSDFDWEPAGFPDSAGYGADVIARQNLEHQLLELEKKYLSNRNPEIAAVLHALGHAWTLQLSCSLHVNKCRPDIARHLFALGRLNLEMGDIPRAKQHLEASSCVSLCLHGSKTHPDMAAASLALGKLYSQALKNHCA